MERVVIRLDGLFLCVCVCVCVCGCVWVRSCSPHVQVPGPGLRPMLQLQSVPQLRQYLPLNLLHHMGLPGLNGLLLSLPI